MTLFNFLPYDPDYCVVNKKLKELYQFYNETYGVNANGVKLSFTVETSDHDGYCSGGECEYTEKMYDIDIYFTERYHSIEKLREGVNKIIKDANGVCDDPFFRFNQSNIQMEQLIPSLNFGSGYCINSNESEEHNLAIHDYRINLISYDLF